MRLGGARSRLGDGSLLDNRQTKAFKTVEFFRAVGKDAKLGKAKVADNLCANAKVAPVHGGMFEAWLRRGRQQFAIFVQPGQQCQSARFLTKVNQRSLTGAANHAQRRGNFARVPGRAGSKHVIEKIFRMDTHHDRFVMPTGRSAGGVIVPEPFR